MSRCSTSPAASSATAASAWNSRRRSDARSDAPRCHQPHSPNQNHLLAALPAAEFERLAAHLELVPMPLGEILYEPGEQLQHAYFPDHRHRVAALRHWSPARRPKSREWATKAWSAFRCSWAATPRPARPSCRPRATLIGWTRHLLKQEFDRAGAMQRLLLRYTQALITQMTQTAACNRHHSVEQQLCRWLLSDARSIARRAS